MKNNKLNAEDCESGLAISDEGLTANHSRPDKWYCIRTVLPIPTLNLKTDKPIIAIYFEAILNFQRHSIINIGFSDRQFPLEKKWLGTVENSIGIWPDRFIYIDRRGTKIGNGTGKFSKGDVVGLGIILQPNSKLECFVTWNGKLLSKAELPPKFANFQLFPAVDLYNGNSARVNFGKQEWQFKEFQSVLH